MPLPLAAVEDLSQLRNQLQDILVLSCSRGLDQKDLRGRGLPQELRVCLEAALGENALTNLHWLSLLGNSKQHMFMNGISWDNRRSRNKRTRAALKAGNVRRDNVASGSREIAVGAALGVTLDGEMAAPDTAKVPTPMMNGMKFSL